MSLDHYIAVFNSLNTDKGNTWKKSPSTRYRAPHKPLLLLAVIDKFALGLISANLIELDFELCELFQSYWAKAMGPERRGNIAMPFFHLQSDGFWELAWRSGFAPQGKIHSVNKLTELSYGARLATDLHELLKINANRDVLRQVLVDGYFSEDVGHLVLEQSDVNRGAYIYSHELTERARKRIRETSMPLGEGTERASRDQGFRKAVRQAYDYTCAMTGIRIVTDDGHVGVQGAHIVPWKDSQDDSLVNGVALSPTCHWAFDEGLVTVTNEFTIRVSPQLLRSPNSPMYLADLKGAKLNLPQDDAFWPDPKNLKWHRNHVFRGR